MGSTWWIMESIWMFLTSRGANASRAAVAAPRRAYTEVRPRRSSAWLGLAATPSSATAAAARSDIAASLREPSTPSPPPPLAATAAWPVASAHSACIARSAAVSAGVGSRGSGPAKVLLLLRYNSIAAAARPRPSPRPRLGRARPNGASRSPGVTRHEPPHRPSCEAIACAAMTRRKWRRASFAPSPPTTRSGSGIADAASTNRSLNSRAARAFVRRIASQYGRRSLAQLVQCPKSLQ
mmetsp:Transcript_1094/g.4166  ORF Transcript_1094/g.4166 Transcript_1094/m.4166 type:complete len:238 (+) Transcript_1094:554-1267(+)